MSYAEDQAMILDHAGRSPALHAYLPNVRPGPVTIAVEIERLKLLNAALEGLQRIFDMAREAFDQGNVHKADERSMIALAGKIVQEADAALHP